MGRFRPTGADRETIEPMHKGLRITKMDHGTTSVIIGAARRHRAQHRRSPAGNRSGRRILARVGPALDLTDETSIERAAVHAAGQGLPSACW
jgi:hypothetical protein